MADKMNQYLSETGSDVSYGQGEPLTRRIHSLLEDYKDGFAVLKELIQNADDAGATQVHFIYDKRDFSKSAKSLMDPEMKHVLGPALLCYNDQVFNNDDFENIVKLSGATKKQKLDKVGRFGLGFNVVYNLTDVPSFISRDSIVFFDPHIKYLREVVKDSSKPGIRLNLKDHGSLIRTKKDQFQVFHGLFGCDVQSDELPTFQGTLFRFPLRSVSQAAESEISTVCYSEDEIKELFHLLQKAAKYLLLFTQNVTCVKVSEIHIGCNPKLCAEIRKAPVELIRSIDYGEANVTPQGHNIEDEYKLLTHACRSRNYIEDVQHSNIIIQVNATFNESALFTTKECISVYWNISSVVGAQTFQFEENSTPVGSVAFCLTKNSPNGFTPEALDSGGSMFCFLPLPIRNQMPVHINGYFAVSPSRRQLCTQEYHDKSDPKAEWNEFIMKGVIQEAYTRALVDMTKKPELFDPLTLPQEMTNIFPTDSKHLDDSLLHLFCRLFYSSVVKNESLKLFYDGNNWRCFAAMKYLDYQISSDLTVTKNMSEVCTIYFDEKLDQKFVELPLLVLDQIEFSGFKSELQSHRITLVEFYRDILMPIIGKIKPSVRDSLICFALLRDVKELSTIIQDCACIPVTCGDSLLKPDQLVDPDGPLKDLYSNNEGPFPKWLVESKTPDKARLQHALTVLGMRVDNINCKETLERAQTISKMKEGTNRAKCLVKLLAVKLKQEKSKEITELMETLCKVKFLPVLEKPVYWHLPWKSNQEYASPDESYMEEQKELVGCSEVIVSFPGSQNAELMAQLHCVEKEVTEEHINRQISSVVEAESIESSNLELKKQVSELHHKIMDMIYAYLNEESEKRSSTEFERYKASPFIMLSNQTFVCPNKCALKCPSGLFPYFHELPSTFQTSYHKLVKVLDIEPSLRAADIVSLLKQLYGGRTEQILEEHMFNVACIAAGELANLQDLNLQETLYLPDCNKLMTSSKTLCFNNCPWIPVTNKKILHHAISYDVASKLGVKSIGEETMRPFQYGIPFGQSEKLTNRIRRILDGYPCDKEILQELLQNAEDAKANEVHFFLDYRSHPNDKVFEGWNSLDGPALLVYNNKPFTKKDLQGIQNLGEGSKGLDPVTTGKYGVGFNCVYHITDTPMFLTPDFEQEDNHLLVAFDPNCKYLLGSSSQNPGQKYTNVVKLKQIFPDLFQWFHVPGKDFTKGTIFRFPLRTKFMAVESDISKNVMAKEAVRELFKTFSANLEQCLLFLQNVREITLNEICDNGLIVVDKVLSIPTERNKGIQLNLNQYVEQMGMITLTNGQRYKHHYELDIEKHNREENAKWLVLQQLGVMDAHSINPELVAGYRKTNAAILPKGGVAIKLKKTSGDSGQNKEDGKNMQLFCLLPLPICTGLAMHINGSFILDETRRNLWQTENKTGFKFLWNAFILQEIVTDLYIDAMEVIAQSMPKSKQHHRDIQTLIAQFSDLFPTLTTNDPYLSTLQNACYHKMIQRMSLLLPVIVYTRMWPELEWYPVGGKLNKIAYFDDLEKQICNENPQCINITSVKVDEENQQCTGETTPLCAHIQIKRILESSRFPITPLKLSIRRNLGKSVSELHTLSPASILKHFHRETFEKYSMTIPANISDTPFFNREGLFLLLDFCKDILSDFLEGLPMLLMADGTVQRFCSRSLVLLSEYHTLIQKKQQRFADTLFMEFMRIEHMDMYLKHMNVADLETMLPHCLDERVYKGIDKKVPFDINNGQLIKWIRLLWKFLSSEIVKEGGGNVIGRQWITEPKIDKTSLAMLKNWCIVPICMESMDRYYLVPPRYLDIVLNLTQKTTLENIFGRIKFPIPIVFCAGFDRVVRHVVASLADARKTVECIAEALRVCKLDFFNLQQYDCQQMLDYLKDNLPQLQTNASRSRLTLLQLPIFQSVFEERVKLDEHFGNTFSIPEEIPQNGMKKWCNAAEKLFLKCPEKYRDLFQFLGVKMLTFTEAYSEHILWHFGVFNTEERYQHLYIIKNFVEQQKFDQKFIMKLKETPVLEDKHGTLLTVCRFFNQREHLFARLEDTFLPYPLNKTNWVDFLKKLGYNYSVEAKHVVEYAHRIAKNEYGDCTKQICTILLKKIFSDQDLFKNCAWNIKHIKFIPCLQPDDSLATLYPSFQCHSHALTCFAGTVTHEYEQLVWTQTNILPDFATPFRRDMYQRMLDALSVLVKPTLPMILENLRLVCENYKPLPQMETTITDYIHTVFQYLQKHHKNDDLDCIQTIACVPVDNGGRLVKPCQIATNLPENIQPHLYSLPSTFYNYFTLLERIGAMQAVTVVQYADVLTSIHEESGHNELDPNQLQASLKSLKGLFQLCQDHQCDVNMLSTKTLYFLTKDKKLTKSSEVVYMDYESYEKRLPDLHLPLMVKKYKTDPMSTPWLTSYELKEALFKLHPLHKFKYISEIVTEKISNEACEMHTTKACREYEDRLCSNEFQIGILRIAKHNRHRLNLGGGGVREEDIDLDFVSQNLQNVKLFEIDELKTHLVYQNEKLEETEQNTEVFSETEDGINRICISTDVWVNKMKIHATVCRVIDDLMEHTLSTHQTHVMSILDCSLKHIRQVLDREKIEPCDCNVEDLPFTPQPGDYIPEDSHELLKQCVFKLEVNDYVGYEEYDPDEERDNLPGESKEGNLLPVYKYAKVVDVLKPDNATSYLHYSYKVNVGGAEYVESHATSLYRFSRKQPNVNELVIQYSDNGDPSDTFSLIQSGDLKGIKENVNKQLTEAWKLNDDQRRKVVKRLWLEFHPDKNSDRVELSTQAFQYLQWAIDRIGNNLPLVEEEVDNCCNYNFDRRSNHEFWDDFNFSGFTRRAQSQGRRNNSRAYPSGGSRPQRPTENRQPTEARRWMKQAKHDLASVQNDRDGQVISHEWACLKCHHAAEKALKATLIAFDADNISPDINNLVRLCKQVPGCRQSADQLQSLVGDRESMSCPSHGIPHDRYTVQHSREAYDLAHTILQMCQDFLNSL